MRRICVMISLLLILTACGEDKEEKSTNTEQPDFPRTNEVTSIPSVTAPLTIFMAPVSVQLADGSTATYQITFAHPPEWTSQMGEATSFLRNRNPMPFPMESGSIEISYSLRAFIPPDLTTLEQALPGAPTNPITLAGYDGLRADFSDEAATHSEGSTILLKLDDSTFLFITVQMAFGERATLEPAALEVLNTLIVTKTP